MVVKKKQENKSEVSLQTCQTFLLIIFAKIFIVDVTGVWQGCKDNSANFNLQLSRHMLWYDVVSTLKQHRVSIGK